MNSDYRGEIKVILINLGNNNFEITHGLRIAQMVLCPVIKANIEEVQDLDTTDRGRRIRFNRCLKINFLPLIIKNTQNKLFLKKFGIIGQKNIFLKNFNNWHGWIGMPFINLLSKLGRRQFRHSRQ